MADAGAPQGKFDARLTSRFLLALVLMAGGVLVWGVYPVVSTGEIVALLAVLIFCCGVLAYGAFRPRS